MISRELLILGKEDLIESAKKLSIENIELNHLIHGAYRAMLEASVVIYKEDASIKILKDRHNYFQRVGEIYILNKK